MKDLLKWMMYGSVFVVPFVLLIVSSTMFFPFITGKNFYFRILVEIGFIAWILVAMVDRAYRPRWSWILPAIVSLVVVMLAAALLGEYPVKSIWSNFERMEGWVTLVHFFMYFLVLTSVLKTEIHWNRFLNTALIAATLMSLYALGQILGAFEVSQGAAWRVDGRLGNSSYLGVYMLFHMFIAAWLFVRSKVSEALYAYAALFLVFGFILFNTGTRGAVLGLIGGSILAFLYVALMAEKGAVIKKWALGALLGLVLVVCSIWVFRDTALVKENQVLNRVANITLAEGNIRFTVWSMALEGVKERPILGWGQENFSYVFSKYYDPALYNAEPWYDRTHNIFLDWLIAGGVLGLAAYLFILFSALWYAVLSPALQRLKGHKDKIEFTTIEQALILGLLAAYMFHNLFVFDNLASWIFYAVVLGLIHHRVSSEWEVMNSFSIDQVTWERILTPFVLVGGLVAVYMINIPGILAAKDIINTYREPDAAKTIDIFERALERESFAEQEVVEQMIQLGSQKILVSDASMSDKNRYVKMTDAAINNLIDNKPGDARLHMIASGFYRNTGDLDRSMDELERAQELSPHKQTIYEDMALISLARDDRDKAAEYYRTAYELDTRNELAQVRLAAVVAYAGDLASAQDIVDHKKLEENTSLWRAYVTESLSFRLYYEAGYYEIVEFILKGRRDIDPSDLETRTNLAALYYEMGDRQAAVAELRQAITDVPSFREEGERLIAELESEI